MQDIPPPFETNCENQKLFAKYVNTASMCFIPKSSSRNERVRGGGKVSVGRWGATEGNLRSGKKERDDAMPYTTPYQPFYAGDLDGGAAPPFWRASPLLTERPPMPEDRKANGSFSFWE